MTISASSPSFTTWLASLSERGFTPLPSSHAVPVELWARGADGHVLHFRARGTSVALREYDASALTGLILRSECDCEAHRTAGAGRRTVLAPGAEPVREARVDGAAEFGWAGIEAGRLDVPAAAALFERLLAELVGTRSMRAAAVA